MQFTRYFSTISYINWGYFRRNSHAILAQLATEIDAILDAISTLFLEPLAT